MAATQIDTVACPPHRRTFNPDGSRIRAPTAAEKAEEEARFAEGRKRWGDRVGRRPTPPPPSSTKDAQAPSTTSSSSNVDDDGNAEQLQKRRPSLSSATTLLPGKEDGGERGKGGLLRRVFGGKRGGERKVKKPDAYIAAAASWDGNVGGEGEVRRERLGKRGG